MRYATNVGLDPPDLTWPAQLLPAITISQPWADLIVSGEKGVENRTWSPRYRGPLVIHAGKGNQYLKGADLAARVTGCVLAVVDLVACLPVEEITRSRKRVIDFSYRVGGEPRSARIERAHLLRGGHCEGPICWVLSDVRRVKPYPVRGEQGLWDFDAGLLLPIESSLEYPPAEMDPPPPPAATPKTETLATDTPSGVAVPPRSKQRSLF